LNGLVHDSVLIGAFVILWFLAFLCLLPVALGADVDKQSGAPLAPRLGVKVLVASAIAVGLWATFYALIALKIVEL
jgi:predicted secreted protein